MQTPFLSNSSQIIAIFHLVHLFLQIKFIELKPNEKQSKEMEKDKKKRKTNVKQGIQNDIQPGARFEELEDNPPTRPAHLWSSHVRQVPITSYICINFSFQLDHISARCFFKLFSMVFSIKLKRKKTSSADGELFYLYLFFKK